MLTLSASRSAMVCVSSVRMAWSRWSNTRTVIENSAGTTLHVRTWLTTSHTLVPSQARGGRGGRGQKPCLKTPSVVLKSHDQTRAMCYPMHTLTRPDRHWPDVRGSLYVCVHVVPLCRVHPPCICPDTACLTFTSIWWSSSLILLGSWTFANVSVRCLIKGFYDSHVASVVPSYIKCSFASHLLCNQLLDAGRLGVPLLGALLKWQVFLLQLLLKVGYLPLEFIATIVPMPEVKDKKINRISTAA